MPRIDSLPIGTKFRVADRTGELLYLGPLGAQVIFLLDRPRFVQPVPGGRSWTQTRERSPRYISLATEVEVVTGKEATR